MNEYLELLREKNHFLKKFYLSNLQELENLTQGNFENLNEFYLQRESILDILTYLTRKIENLEDHFSLQKIQTSDTVNSVKSKNETLSNDILKQNMDILSLIEAAKSSIIKELQKVKTGKKVISSYKSPNPEQRRTHGRESDSLK